MSKERFPSLTEVGDSLSGGRFIFKWQYHLLGHFHTTLAKAITLADQENLDRLAKGFPDEVQAMRRFHDGAGWWDEVEEGLYPFFFGKRRP